MPSLMMRMLEDLDITTATGSWRWAPATTPPCSPNDSARLGDTHVASIDPELVAAASRRLAAHGYRPHLVAADGITEVSDHAPYDRIIADVAQSTLLTRDQDLKFNAG
jgi:hypothetical protein